MKTPLHFIVVAPLYIELSDGIRMLHFLCHSLNKIGIKSSLVFTNCLNDMAFSSLKIEKDGYGTNKDLSTPVVKDWDEIDLQNDVIIYPEIIQDNPLNAKKIVRYFLNKDGFVSGKKVHIGDDDFILSYQKIFNPNAHFNLFYTLFDYSKTPSRNSVSKLVKSISVTHIGKGALYGDCFRVEETIGLDWKKSREEYLILLESAKYLFTWDPLSGVVHDAVMRGCIPVVISTKPWSLFELDNMEIPVPFMTIQEFNLKEKFCDNFDLFLDLRDEMIEAGISSQNNWDSQLRLFSEKIFNFF